MRAEITKIRNMSPFAKRMLLAAGLLAGLFIGYFIAFNVMFLYHVLPHGGF